ncbi:MAG: hypothetical protein A3J59_02800 [Candidatus Buchananbacteria bacterium RIFCSPHIGHO2_02_FULL_56_16]|uniref:Chloroplast import component protein (Tic20) n=1 Tax=Candidatus Buchananbacteria bacterium RIFCSPHIGHO2_02_FULL_56_16 TaxID=1797542 RepID=A0A1G1YDS7_9BACT|nr:MAG: hypothetical protein A3J59_02800 [Candidatus Buchananbacteria bacterium RIFCSPHIGHO2_02_FULL_56_16]
MADIKQPVSSEDKVWGAVGYLWILSLIALAARKNNDFIRFHASQGALLFAISVVLMLIPGIGWFINLLVAIVAIVGIIKALQGERWPVPVVGGMAKQFGDWIIKTAKL